MKAPEARSLRDIIEDAFHGEASVYLVRHGSTVMNRGVLAEIGHSQIQNRPLFKNALEAQPASA